MSKAKSTKRATRPTKAQIEQKNAEMRELINALLAEKEQNAFLLAEKEKKIADLAIKQEEQERQIVELKTKKTRTRSQNRTSKGQKFSKNENTAFDILVFLFQSDYDEMCRVFKGKKAQFDYSEIIAFMQTEDRNRIGDRWAERRFDKIKNKDVGSTYILFPNTDWNYKSSTSCLGRRFVQMGFYPNVDTQGKIMTISRCTEQTYLDKDINMEICEKRHDIFMSFIRQDREGDFTKEQYIREINDLK